MDKLQSQFKFESLLLPTGLTGRAGLEDFADEVGDLVELAQGMDGAPGAKSNGLADLFSRNKVCY